MTFLSNFSLLAHCIAKVALNTGIGPGLVILGLYNFQRRFVPKILSGAKTHTIRAIRAHPDKAGNTLHLYVGLRHKSVQLLMRVLCVKVEEIEIDACGHECNCDPMIVIDGVELSESEREGLAVRDGFDSFDEMLEFWAGRLPFRGHIIHWQFPSPSSGGGQLADNTIEFNSSGLSSRATSSPRKALVISTPLTISEVVERKVRRSA
jgi:hypothetical protein